MFRRLIVGGVYGFIAGLAWDIALDLPLMSGWRYSMIIGASLSVLIFSAASTTRRNISRGVVCFAATVYSLFVFFAAIGTALIAWLTRFIFS